MDELRLSHSLSKRVWRRYYERGQRVILKKRVSRRYYEHWVVSELGSMYRYRRLSREQKREVLDARRLAGLPSHEPFHPQAASQTYFITAANFNHVPILDTERRRIEFQEELLAELLDIAETDVLAWCILPNHYHLLIKTDLELFGKTIGRLHNGTSTRWNREDATRGRHVWFRFNDRGIRSERHLQVCLNYIHANPVKHRYVKLAYQWPSSSYALYAERYGSAILRQLWEEFPVLDFGKGWDEFQSALP